MTVREFTEVLDTLYPKTLSCTWDTDGLQCSPDPDKEIKRVLVALDANEKEIDAAVSGGFDMLLTHHPMIFGGVCEVTPDTYVGNRILKLVRAGISAASYHTRLDAGAGGVNDTLAHVLGFEVSDTFGDEEMPTAGRIVTFPEPMSANAVCRMIKEKLANVCAAAPQVRLSGGGEIKKLAMVGGAGKDFIRAALAAGADAFLTGEASYNAAIDAAEYGIAVIEAGHYHTEYPVCARLAALVRDIAKAEAVIYTAPTQVLY